MPEYFPHTGQTRMVRRGGLPAPSPPQFSFSPPSADTPIRNGSALLKQDPQLKKSLLLITYTVLLLAVVLNLKAVLAGAGLLFGLLKPLIYGVAVAFLLNLPMTWVERLLRRLESALPSAGAALLRRLRRPLAIVLSVLLVVGGLGALISFILPQLAQSVAVLVESFPGYWDNFTRLADQFFASMNLNLSLEELDRLPWQDWVSQLGALAGDLFPRLFDSTKNITSAIGNLFLSIFLSFYMLMNKEGLVHQVRKVLYAFLPKAQGDWLCSVGRMTNRTMSLFLTGQLAEALILGVLCFVGMTLLGMPYAPLIGVIIGVTNLIPFFGPIIGTIPCAFIILVVDFWQAVFFVLFVLLLQQVDQRLIYPKVVGSSVGLPGMWVMMAILVGGGLFGIWGMVLGVPACAVAYSVFREYVHRRLSARGIAPDSLKG